MFILEQNIETKVCETTLFFCPTILKEIFCWRNDEIRHDYFIEYEDYEKFRI